MGAGVVNQTLLRGLAQRGFPVIAADGGANLLKSLDIDPDAVVGDMDSLCPSHPWPENTRLIEIAEQETTDFEKCLYTIQAAQYLCFGFLDGRLDHTLATIHALTKYSRHKILLFGVEDLIIPVDHSVRFPVEPGDRVSIYPLTRCEFVRSRGLKYPLDGLFMEQGISIGTSNQAQDCECNIELASGCYALILEMKDRQMPDLNRLSAI